MNDYESLPQQLQEARIRAGKTQGAAAKRLGCTAQAISNWERGYTRIDCVSLFRLLNWYGTDIYDFFRACGLEESPAAAADSEEERLLSLFRSMGEEDRDKLCRIAEILSGVPAKHEKENKAARIIPLFRFLAAAGIPSPQPGEDYEDLSVDADNRADFAARIGGDSMEPHIHDGEIVYCQRRVDLKDGDVGIFYTDGGMVCKQFYRDSEGNVHLFSVNRARRDADLFYTATSGMALFCYGKVLLSQRIPLPED